ncbi:MAG: primosomal protein N' [Treponema sp.]|jgi:primosomal protein N' (replication factor Y)|nr:primosomal protein N' [Treponema sp.]
MELFDIVFDLPVLQTFTYRVDSATKGVASVGKRVVAPLGRRELVGYIIAEREHVPAGLDSERVRSIRRVVDAELSFDSRTIALAQWLSAFYFCSLGEALAIMIPSGRRVASTRVFTINDDEISDTALVLSDEQERALQAIIAPQVPLSLAPRSMSLNTAAPSLPPPSMFYLYGITGSGKTEVFLRAAQTMLDAGKSVIYLVPEIALTYQTTEAIGKRFGAVASTFHSGMTVSARFTEWTRIMRGEVRIVVGPRSAVFAPVRDLGLIIIDEEHDGSYKSGSTPRYHARQVAMRRCSAEGARLLMGSATPSLEAWKLMGDKAITRLDLTRRLSGGNLPEIRPVNLTNTTGCLSKELKEEIRTTAQMGRQTILFLNRRGFAYFYHCSACGYELTCKNCSVSLTWHRDRNQALCHYCGHHETPPLACPQCGSLTAGYAGFGTEMIEDEVRRTFPDLRIRRADADSTSVKGSLQETLELFKAHCFDILLGTQMVAKGLNFPGVRLVGVVLADSGLHLPDFRAVERVFSLIVQVAGRSGRYFPDGKVIVQTYRPNDPSITSACSLDVAGFFKAELAQREMLGFPPYTRLIRFTIRGKDEQRANAAISRLASIIAPLLPPSVDMLGPAECPISVIAQNHRRQILIRSKSMSMLHGATRGILAAYECNKDSRVHLEVDVDPVSLL